MTDKERSEILQSNAILAEAYFNSFVYFTKVTGSIEQGYRLAHDMFHAQFGKSEYSSIIAFWDNPGGGKK